MQEKDKYQKAKAKARKNGRFKAIALLVLGIAMLMFLVEPLTQSVRIFSENLKIVPFYVSFILVPLATNARAAIAAIIAAKQKRHHTTSLTFSQVCPPSPPYNTIIITIRKSLLTDYI